MKQIALVLLLALPALPTPGAVEQTVTIHDDAFSPATLTVEAGQTVTFANRDDDAHTVTATDGSFDSKGLDSGSVWQHRFDRPGTYAYFCELHPFMKGTIVVKPVTP